MLNMKCILLDLENKAIDSLSNPSPHGLIN